MRFRDKIGPLHDPILKPAILPDFLAVARRCLRNRLNRSELRVEVNEEDRRAAAYIALYGFERLEVDAIPSAEIQS